MKPEDIKLGIEINGETETFKRISEMIIKVQEEELSLRKKIIELSSENIVLTMENGLLRKHKGNLEKDPLKAACKVFDISIHELKSKTNRPDVVDARRILYNYYKKKHPRWTYEKIGSFVNKDYATVGYGLKTFDDIFKTDKDFQEKVNEFNREVR